MIYINLGFQKSSLTNLQTNFYPALKGIHYIGRFYNQDNYKLFSDLNDLVDNRREFSDNEYISLVNNFEEYQKNFKKILISQENWNIPYQRNHKTNKIEIVPQRIKHEKLLNFLNKIKIDYKIFFIQRNLEESIPSLFATMSDRINSLFGEQFLDINYFLDCIEKKKNGYEKLLLLLNVYNLKEIHKTFPKNKITIFQYDDLKNDKKKFLNDFSNYLQVPINQNNIHKLDIKTRISKKNKENYYFKNKNILLKTFKIFVPKFLLNKTKYLLKYKLINYLFFKKIAVNYKKEILKKIILEYF